MQGQCCCDLLRPLIKIFFNWFLVYYNTNKNKNIILIGSLYIIIQIKNKNIILIGSLYIIVKKEFLTR